MSAKKTSSDQDGSFYQRIKPALALAIAAFAVTKIVSCGDNGSGGGGSGGDIVTISGTVFSLLEAERCDQTLEGRAIDVNQIAGQGQGIRALCDNIDLARKWNCDVLNGFPVQVIVDLDPADNCGSRISALIDIRDQPAPVRDLNGASDIAAEAGLRAVDDASIAATELTLQRINNLEAGAQFVINTRGVNFRDPADMTAAALIVREITNDGAFAPGSCEPTSEICNRRDDDCDDRVDEDLDCDPPPTRTNTQPVPPTATNTPPPSTSTPENTATSTPTSTATRTATRTRTPTRTPTQDVCNLDRDSCSDDTECCSGFCCTESLALIGASPPPECMFGNNTCEPAPPPPSL